MPDKKLAVITGASSGIGAMFARKLAARGYDLLLVARREDRLRSVATELSETYHVSANVIAADLAVDADRDRVAERIQSAPNLALLVNNAGFGTMGFFFDIDLESQLQMHRLHVIAAMHLTHAALANLVPRQTGGVINVSSVAAFAQTAGSVSYCATKAWMNIFTATLHSELEVQKSPVKVQALCPGFTLSEFHDAARIDRGPIPQALWLTADFVVSESLRGFDEGKLFVIPGWRYKLLVMLLKSVPGWALRKMSARGAQKYRKPVAPKSSL
jgi:short-subunit dehydrogenase